MSRRDDLRFDPMTGKPWEGMPLSPETYRTLYPHRTWLFSPHTGVQRSSESVVENPHMEYVAVPPHRHVPIMTLDECCATEGAQPGGVQFAGPEPVSFSTITVDGATYTWSDAMGDAGLRRARDYLDMLIRTRTPRGS